MRTAARIGFALLLVPLASAAAGAQVACSTTHPGNRQTRSCTVVLSATLQLPAQAMLTLERSSTDLTGGSPLTDARFQAAADTGLLIVGPALSVVSNRGISVTLVNAPQFQGPGIKPASDVQLGVGSVRNACGGVPLSPLSTSPEAVQRTAPRVLLRSSAPLSQTLRQLCLRVRWRYASDPPGSYALPLTISITAP
jgi:hypothetical protein